MPTYSWEGYGAASAAAASARERTKPAIRPSLSDKQKAVLGRITGLAYGHYERRGRSQAPDCIVAGACRGRRGKLKWGMMPVWRLNSEEERLLLVVTLDWEGPDWTVRGGQAYCSDGRPRADGTVVYLPIEMFVLDHRISPRKLQTLLEKARAFTAG